MENIFSFSLEYSHPVNEIGTPITISCRSELCEMCDQPVHHCNAIWDTGATSSMITREIAEKLGLHPIGNVKIAGVHGAQSANVYEVDLVFGNGCRIPAVRVSEATGSGGFDVLLGMDIISRGVFVIDGSGKGTRVYFACPTASS
ncbi:MAG: hypothetical protein HPZ91_07645 [Lentisphaeria bacterium]|nr:hypothetical protein [Lentisphaeria bacterium]